MQVRSGVDLSAGGGCAMAGSACSWWSVVELDGGRPHAE